MGRRGPAPDPIPLKILKGDGRGRDQAGKPIPHVPAFERACPTAPDWLAPEARELWERVAPALDALDLLKPEDRETFAAYCTCWSRFVDAVRTYQREGVIFEDVKGGYPRQHPAVKIAEAAGRDLFRHAREFGLTPSAEVALAVPPKLAADDDDPFAAGASYDR